MAHAGRTCAVNALLFVGQEDGSARRGRWVAEPLSRSVECTARGKIPTLRAASVLRSQCRNAASASCGRHFHEPCAMPALHLLACSDQACSIATSPSGGAATQPDARSAQADDSQQLKPLASLEGAPDRRRNVGDRIRGERRACSAFLCPLGRSFRLSAPRPPLPGPAV